MIWTIASLAGLTVAAAAAEPDRRVEGARAVAAAVRRAARENAQLPPLCRSGAVGPFRRVGDELTMFYLAEAAAAARKLPSDQVPAFLIAVGVSLDDSPLLRDNPLTSRVCRAVETDVERADRLSVLGQPTLHGRRDLCQHFAVSAALTELTSEKLAEAAGLLKEQKDMHAGGSGFSLVDLQADLAGVAFAAALKRGDRDLDAVGRPLRPGDLLPPGGTLREGLDSLAFQKSYGGFADPRFRKETDAIRASIRSLSFHAKNR